MIQGRIHRAFYSVGSAEPDWEKLSEFEQDLEEWERQVPNFLAVRQGTRLPVVVILMHAQFWNCKVLLHRPLYVLHSSPLLTSRFAYTEVNIQHYSYPVRATKQQRLPPRSHLRRRRHRQPPGALHLLVQRQLRASLLQLLRLHGHDYAPIQPFHVPFTFLAVRADPLHRLLSEDEQRLVQRGAHATHHRGRRS